MPPLLFDRDIFPDDCLDCGRRGGIRNEGQSLRSGLPAQHPFIITQALCASRLREIQREKRELESYECGGVSPRDCQRAMI